MAQINYNMYGNMHNTFANRSWNILTTIFLAICAEYLLLYMYNNMSQLQYLWQYAYYIGQHWMKYFMGLKSTTIFLEIQAEFLAVQNNSIGDLVTHWLTDWLRVPFTFEIQRATLETCDLWDIGSEWWRQMTWPKKTMTKIKTKTMTMTKTNTFWEHIQRATLETCVFETID